ncbi:MAG: hypothetical protein ACYTGN_07110 [Planctomycetota bacterium]
MSKQLLLALTGLLFMWGCGGGGSSDPEPTPGEPPTPTPVDTLAPFGRVTFPPPRSLTDHDRLTVTGTAGDNDSGVDTVNVNGLLATSDDGFATWHVVVPLALGSNVLQLEIEDRAGNTKAAGSVVVDRDTRIWAAPSALAIDASAGAALVADGTLGLVFRVDLATGEREVLPRSGSRFVAPAGAALHAAATKRLLLTDSVQGAVLAVDADTGVTDFLSLGPPLATPRAIAVDAPRGRALVADLLADALIAVDLVTGDATTFVIGFDGPRGVVVDAAAGLAYVTDAGGLHSVDLDDGTVVTITDTLAAADALTLDGTRVLVVEGLTVVAVELGTGAVTEFADGFAFPRALAVDGTRAFATDSGLDGLFALDLATGARTSVSRTSFGTGTALAFPRGLAIDLVNERAFAIDFTVGVLRIDLTTGDRVVLAGSGPALVTPLSAAFDGRENRVLVADTGLAALVGVDAATGEREILSDSNTGQGGVMIGPRDVQFDPVSRLAFVVDTSLAALLAIDLANGNRALVSGLGRGGGPTFMTPRAVAVDAPNELFLVADTGNGTVFQVDLATGTRSAFGPSGSAVSNTTGLVLDRAQSLLLLTDTVLDGVVAIDTVTGTVSIDGTGPSMPSPEAIRYDAVAGRMFVVDSAMGALMAVEPVSRDRVIVSK